MDLTGISEGKTQSDTSWEMGEAKVRGKSLKQPGGFLKTVQTCTKALNRGVGMGVCCLLPLDHLLNLELSNNLEVSFVTL